MEGIDENIPFYAARFLPTLPKGETKAFIVPVKWWAYDNDRLDGRGPAKLLKANIRARGVDAAEARRLVFREWGDYATVGTPVPA